MNGGGGKSGGQSVGFLLLEGYLQPGPFFQLKKLGLCQMQS